MNIKKLEIRRIKNIITLIWYLSLKYIIDVYSSL